MFFFAIPLISAAISTGTAIAAGVAAGVAGYAGYYLNSCT